MYIYTFLFNFHLGLCDLHPRLTQCTNFTNLKLAQSFKKIKQKLHQIVKKHALANTINKRQNNKSI